MMQPEHAPSHESESRMQELLDRLLTGDGSAVNTLLGITAERLYTLAHQQLHRSFPRLANRHDPASIAHETYLRLHQALTGATVPASPHELIRFAAFKVRQVLLDLAARQDRDPGQGVQPTDQSHDIEPRAEEVSPTQLAIWAEFHEQVGELPEDLRNVFEMHYYLGMTQQQIATLLQEHPKSISRRWLEATQRLADNLPELEA